ARLGAHAAILPGVPDLPATTTAWRRLTAVASRDATAYPDPRSGFTHPMVGTTAAASRVVEQSTGVEGPGAYHRRRSRAAHLLDSAARTGGRIRPVRQLCDEIWSRDGAADPLARRGPGVTLRARSLGEEPSMGQRIEPQVFTREDRTHFRHKLRRCLQAFSQMVEESRFDPTHRSTGFEIELNLVDDRGDPALKNTEVLAAIADPAFQTELALYNMEV